MARFKNANWDITPVSSTGSVGTWAESHAALLMDIRDELQTLNRLLGCPNFTRIPMVLDKIVANTKRRAVKRGN